MKKRSKKRVKRMKKRVMPLSSSKFTTIEQFIGIRYRKKFPKLLLIIVVADSERIVLR